MSKHTKEGNKPEVKAEEPKPAETTTTTVDKAEKKPRAPRTKNYTYRLRDGVDVSKFNGQRQCVVKALQKLASNADDGATFTIADITGAVEGLVTKTPLDASVAYHLKGLAADNQVEQKEIASAPAAAEEKAA